MSLLPHIQSITGKVHGWQYIVPFKHVQFTTSQKIAIWSVGVMGVSAFMVGVLARYFARRRIPSAADQRLQKIYQRRLRSSKIRSPNGDLRSVAGSSLSERVSRSPRRAGSSIVLSDRLSMASGSVGGAATIISNIIAEAPILSPQQLGVMGMEALETSINYWEEALARFTSDSGVITNTPEETEFCGELQQLIDAAYLLQEQCELLFLDHNSVLFKCESGSGGPMGKNAFVLANQDSSAESFTSARDEVADLREFEEFSEYFPDIENLSLYQSALKEFEVGIPSRSLRTENVGCGSDTEFLCKLHCIRLAFQIIFKDANTWTWFADAGRQLLTDLLLFGDRDPKEFLVAYEEMLTWISDDDNWELLKEELETKGVTVITFYDVVLDFILLDAFEDLTSPPSSVTAVVQNRWLSNGFKETALQTAVWSVLKAKRRMLKYPSGFMFHFYNISEQLSPLMAWGFLGPDDGLKEICIYFKEQVMHFLHDTFNFQRTRYNSIEELSIDVMMHIKTRLNNISHKLSRQNI